MWRCGNKAETCLRMRRRVCVAYGSVCYSWNLRELTLEKLANLRKRPGGGRQCERAYRLNGYDTKQGTTGRFTACLLTPYPRTPYAEHALSLSLFPGSRVWLFLCLSAPSLTYMFFFPSESYNLKQPYLAKAWSIYHQSQPQKRFSLMIEHKPPFSFAFI